MLLAAAALFALLAADLLALLISLSVLDLLVFVFDVERLKKAEQRKSAVFWLATKLLATFTLVWVLAAFGSRGNLSLVAIPERSALLIILAAALRLGLFPFNPRTLAPSTPSLALSTLTSSVSALPAFLLLGRAAAAAQSLHSAWLILALVPALFATAKWFFEKDDGAAPGFWYAALASFAFSAALAANSAAVLALGLVMLAAGPALWLSEDRGDFRWLLAAAGFLFLSGLPFTASHSYLRLLSPQAAWLLFLFIPLWALLLAGWLRRALHPPLAEERAEQRLRAVQLSGTALLVLSLAWLGIGLAADPLGGSTFGLLSPLLILALTAAFFWAGRRKFYLRKGVSSRLQFLLSFAWFYLFTGNLLRSWTGLLRLIGRLLEGEAGILWALLFVALLLSLLGQLAAVV